MLYRVQMLAVADELGSSEEELIEALLVAGGVGIVSAAQGPISGAEEAAKVNAA